MIGDVVSLYALLGFWKQAVEYSSLYYDKMNEIRIVTGMTEQEAENLGESYRQMAKD